MSYDQYIHYSEEELKAMLTHGSKEMLIQRILRLKNSPYATRIPTRISSVIPVLAPSRVAPSRIAPSRVAPSTPTLAPIRTASTTASSTTTASTTSPRAATPRLIPPKILIPFPDPPSPPRPIRTCSPTITPRTRNNSSFNESLPLETMILSFQEWCDYYDFQLNKPSKSLFNPTKIDLTTLTSLLQAATNPDEFIFLFFQHWNQEKWSLTSFTKEFHEEAFIREFKQICAKNATSPPIVSSRTVSSRPAIRTSGAFMPVYDDDYESDNEFV
jgi:hypothetical protein